VNVGYADIIATDHTARHDTKRLRDQQSHENLIIFLLATRLAWAGPPRELSAQDLCHQLQAQAYCSIPRNRGAERQENTKDE